jgi:hypothetical protein
MTLACWSGSGKPRSQLLLLQQQQQQQQQQGGRRLAAVPPRACTLTGRIAAAMLAHPTCRWRCPHMCVALVSTNVCVCVCVFLLGGGGVNMSVLLPGGRGSLGVVFLQQSAAPSCAE